MREKKKFRMIGLLVVLLSSLFGCGIRRETDVSAIFINDNQDIKTAKVIRIGYETVELPELLETFLNMTESQAEEYRLEDTWSYEVNEQFLDHGYMEGGMGTSERKANNINYEYNKDSACMCYSYVLSSFLYESLNTYALEWELEQSDLNSCTAEDAIERCKPYAELLGYEDAKVTAYAIPLDVIKENSIVYDFSTSGKTSLSSAPEEGSEVILKSQIRKAQKEGNEELAVELMTKRNSDPLHKEIPWEEKHEVFYLVYRSYLDGIIMAETPDNLAILYSPLYDSPIWVSGYSACMAEEILEEKILISQEKAVSDMLLTIGRGADDVEIADITLVYALQFVIEGDNGWDKAIPCWKIDYIWNQENYTHLIDAIYGGVYKRYPFS